MARGNKMGDTKFIKEIDWMLKEHYGDDFEWDTLFVSNFNKDKGVGYVGINLDEGEGNARSSNWKEFLDAKIKANYVS